MPPYAKKRENGVPKRKSKSRSKSGDVEDSSSVIAEPGDIQSPEGKLANLIEAMGISYQHDMLSSDKGAFLGIGDQFVAKF